MCTSMACDGMSQSLSVSSLKHSRPRGHVLNHDQRVGKEMFSEFLDFGTSLKKMNGTHIW